MEELRRNTQEKAYLKQTRTTGLHQTRIAVQQSVLHFGKWVAACVAVAAHRCEKKRSCTHLRDRERHPPGEDGVTHAHCAHQGQHVCNQGDGSGIGGYKSPVGYACQITIPSTGLKASLARAAGGTCRGQCGVFVFQFSLVRLHTRHGS